MGAIPHLPIFALICPPLKPLMIKKYDKKIVNKPRLDIWNRLWQIDAIPPKLISNIISQKLKNGFLDGILPFLKLQFRNNCCKIGVAYLSIIRERQMRDFQPILELIPWDSLIG